MNDPHIKMRSIRVTFNSGKVVKTSINGTRQSIQDYYNQGFDYLPNFDAPKKIEFLGQNITVNL